MNVMYERVLFSVLCGTTVFFHVEGSYDMLYAVPWHLPPPLVQES